MASLVEELITVLEEEEKLYQTLIDYAKQKREILIKADVPALEKLTVFEQLASDDLLALSNRQAQALKDVASVLGKGEKAITVTELVGMLSAQPEIQQKLDEAKNKLLAAAGEANQLNKQNEVLITQAMELTQFDITLFKSLRQAPETANYNRNAYNTGSIL